ncbi:MAG: deoxynucleoside kinase [Oscillospiraceae bacterium]|nr:deoxynucleoside kinase [Oscillospiraceae bacterium]
MNSLNEKINTLLKQKDFIIIGIDGRCGSGKTTFAEKLSEHFDLNLFKMDDFFLPKLKKTPERLSEIGGNCDFERFKKEVLENIVAQKSFEYFPYDCKSDSFKNGILVNTKKINIVEGSYSLHPQNIDFFDVKVLLKISKDEQKRRILKREGENADMFFNKWIPLEESYFTHIEALYNFDFIY